MKKNIGIYRKYRNSGSPAMFIYLNISAYDLKISSIFSTETLCILTHDMTTPRKLGSGKLERSEEVQWHKA